MTVGVADAGPARAKAGTEHSTDFMKRRRVAAWWIELIGDVSLILIGR